MTIPNIEMNILMSLYILALFVALTPGVLLRLPSGGNKKTVAVVHGLVFAAVFYITYKTVWRFTSSMDGFAGPTVVLPGAGSAPPPPIAGPRPMMKMPGPPMPGEPIPGAAMAGSAMAASSMAASAAAGSGPMMPLPSAGSGRR